MQTKVPPHSSEAEQGVLGCAMLGGGDTIAEIAACCSADDFYDLRHRQIFEAVMALWDRREAVDVVTLTDVLRTGGKLEQCGGVGYVMSLPNTVPSAANLPYYAGMLREKRLLRNLIDTCRQYAVRAYSFDGKIEELLASYEQASLAIGRLLNGNETGPANLREVQKRLMAEYEEAAQNGKPQGITTGFSDLDWKLGGWMPNDLVIVGGRPSTGKTTLALAFMLAALKAGVKCSFVSLETSAARIVHRLQCSEGAVDGGPFRNGTASGGDVARMVQGSKAVARLRDSMFIHERPMTDAQLAAAARSDWQRGSRLFFVDYLQLIDTKGDTPVDRASKTSKALKRLAQELSVPVIVVSSLNRDVEGKPKLSNLRESGQIEFDADKVLLLSTDEPDMPVREVCVDIAKNKDGGLGECALTLHAGQFRFEGVQKTT